MMMMGTTISLAGKPRMKAIRITPSRPSSRAKGSRKPVQWFRMLTPPTVTLAQSQISRPAGAATATARPSTNSVRSSTERAMTLPIWGRRYGGSSSVKEEGTPRRMVPDSSRDTQKVMNTPSRMTPVSSIAETRDCPGPA